MCWGQTNLVLYLFGARVVTREILQQQGHEVFLCLSLYRLPHLSFKNCSFYPNKTSRRWIKHRNPRARVLQTTLTHPNNAIICTLSWSNFSVLRSAVHLSSLKSQSQSSCSCASRCNRRQLTLSNITRQLTFFTLHLVQRSCMLRTQFWPRRWFLSWAKQTVWSMLVLSLLNWS